MSPARNHVRYAFLGRIIQVCNRIFSSPFLFDSRSLQLRPLDLSTDQPIGHSDVPAQITACGRVLLTEENVPTFLITIVLTPYLGALLSHMTFCGLLPVHSGCGCLFHCVPQGGTFLSFTGVILAIKNDVPTISVDDFALLPQRSLIVITMDAAENDDASTETVD